jgi:cyclohexadienyl dehydratase
LRRLWATAHETEGKTPFYRTLRAHSCIFIDRGDSCALQPGWLGHSVNVRWRIAGLSSAALPNNYSVRGEPMKRAAWILAGQADVMVTDASETLLQQKLNPGLCSVHPDKPFQYGEKAWLLPRGDVVFQQYVGQWLHLAQATGEYQAISDKWLK